MTTSASYHAPVLAERVLDLKATKKSGTKTRNPQDAESPSPTARLVMNAAAWFMA